MAQHWQYCLVFLMVASFVVSQPASDKITHLPGLSAIPSFDQYSGYVNITGFGQMFYWFVESQNNPVTDPVVLWLNGGPGCSSLNGFLSENGPWFPNATLQLVENPYSWNRIANMLYIESPPGVGFSVNEAKFDHYDDNTTAEANYRFLEDWFALFPDFQPNDFWITGESYGGHYIPTLVHRILQKQDDPNTNVNLNLKGFAVGNPATDLDYDNGPLYSLYFPTHGLYCLDPQFDGPGFGNMDPYDILADVCYESTLVNQVRFPSKGADRIRKKLEHYEELRRPVPMPRDVPSMPACIGDYMTDYLNQASVQKAIHAIPKTWEGCGGVSYAYGYESIIPFYQYILDNSELQMLVYSGDEDTVVPFMGTEQWVLDLKQPNQTMWGPWYSEWSGDGNQVAGYWIDMTRIWYATVKGAGHMVPWFQPGAAFDMFQRFLEQISLDG